MAKWILSIVATVFLTTVINLILPEGKLSKYIKFIMGFLIIFVVIQPIFSLKTEDYNINIETSKAEMLYQSDFLKYVANEKVQNFQENCEQILQQKGFKYCSVNIQYTVEQLGQINVDCVTVDLKNAVYIYDSRHIDIIEDIILPVSKYLEIEEKQVNVIE